MLILSRQARQTIVIGNDITITVKAIKGNQVSLAIAAPASVSIDRKEVRERKKRLPETPQASYKAY